MRRGSSILAQRIDFLSADKRLTRLAVASLVPICPNATMSRNRRVLAALPLNGVLNGMRRFKRIAGIPPQSGHFHFVNPI